MSKRMSDERLKLLFQAEVTIADFMEALSIIDECAVALIAERSKVRELEAKNAKLDAESERIALKNDDLRWLWTKAEKRAEAAEAKVARVEALQPVWIARPANATAQCLLDLIAALQEPADATNLPEISSKLVNEERLAHIQSAAANPLISNDHLGQMVRELMLLEPK